ncbi:MAG: element excision factor XisH family protein [Candidatus Poribacteria bacterium]|nr:element excision factor XisH family protein [Candidatus Poribacteria bacterium]
MPAKDIYHDTVKNALIKDGLLIFSKSKEVIVKWNA